VNRIFLAVYILITSPLFAGRKFPAHPDEETVPGEVIVRLRPGADPTGLLNRIARGAALSRAHPRANLFRLQLPSPVTEALLDRFAADPDVEFVEPNRVRSTTGIPAPSDPYYSSQWALDTVRALEAWRLIPDQYQTSANASPSRVKVAILDTGADCTHPDFINSGGTSVYSNAGGQLSQELSHAFVLTTIVSPACPWQDDHGHGTHTAGTLAAAVNNTIGVSGAGLGVELIVYKVLASTGSGGDYGIASAIMSAADAGARVVSMSLGGPGYSQTLQDAVDYAWSRDTVVVAAAGNNNNSALFFPAGANHVIGVAATDSTNARALFSNFGPGVDIAAPGVGILSLRPSASYATLSGTSMAAPHVAAVAGMIAKATPGLASQAITQRIQGSAASTTGGGWTAQFGYGIVNAFSAVSGKNGLSTTGGVTGQVGAILGFG